MSNFKEFILLADTVSQEKNISKEQVLNSIADGIETALRKNFPEGSLIQADIVPEEHEIKAWRLFKLVNSIENVEAEMLFNEVENEIVEDGYVWEPIDINLTRQQFNIVKQVTLNKIKNTSKQEQIEDILSKPNQLLLGVVKVIKKESLLVDYNNVEIIIPKSQLTSKDSYKVNDKIFFVLIKDRNGYIGSKTADKYIEAILKKNIVQIEDGEIEIVKIARVPGFRTKVLVKSNKSNIEAVKTCIGFKGANIKAINNLLNGEYLDIINYSNDIPTLLVNCMAPIHLTSILVNEDTNQINIAVKDDEIALAIGKNKQNLNLINKIMPMPVNIFSESAWKDKNETESVNTIEFFKYTLSCDDELASILVSYDFSSLEEIAYVEKDEFPLEEIDIETVEQLQANAKDILKQKPNLTVESFLFMKNLGLSFDDCVTLIEKNTYTKSDIGDLSSFEMQEILPELDIEKINHIIMECRK